MRDIWHCTPSEFREQRLSDYLVAIKVMNIEQRVKNMRNARKDKRGG